MPEPKVHSYESAISTPAVRLEKKNNRGNTGIKGTEKAENQSAEQDTPQREQIVNRLIDFIKTL